MGVFQHHVDAGGSEVRKVFACQLFERGDHGRTVALGHRLLICTEFRAAAACVGQKADQGIEQAKQHAQNDVRKAEIDVCKAKSGAERGMGDDHPNDHAHQKHVAEIENLPLEHVLMQSVSQLVCKNGANLVGLHGVDQVVVQHDGLHFAKAGKVGVELGGAARGVHDLDCLYLVAVLGQKLHESVLELTVLQGREFVADAAEDGVHERDKQRKEQHADREDQNHPVAKEAAAPQKACQQQRENQLQDQVADAIHDKGFDGRAVKAVFLLDDHVGDIAAHNAQHRAHSHLQQNHRQKLHEHTGREQRGKCRVSTRRQKRQRDSSRYAGEHNTQHASFAAVSLPFLIGLGIKYVRDVCRGGVACRAHLYNAQHQVVKRARKGKDQNCIIHNNLHSAKGGLYCDGNSISQFWLDCKDFR